ncbi:hypothetical protein AB1Y20_014847 [Prymnesium parvum]|uniref:AAA+ ATPase domain-containing protein n=1 Tax=Prymnesium parvum TaxID=97485 RepID=A0AB34JYW3_PRYPA
MSGRCHLSAARLAAMGAAYGDAVVVVKGGEEFLCTAWPAAPDAPATSPDAPLADCSFRLPSPRPAAAAAPPRRLEHSLSPPPLAQSVWLTGTPRGPSSLDADSLRRRCHAQLCGQLVSRGVRFRLAAAAHADGCTLTVTRVTPAGGAARCVGATALQLSLSPSPPLAAPAAHIFPSQRRAYAAVCRLLRAATLHAERLRGASIRAPSGLLLYGPPGTGKTHVVRAAAAAGGLPLVALRPEERRAKLSAQLASAFEHAEARAREASSAAGTQLPALLFLDELDTICPKRADSSSSEEQLLAVATLLTLMDGVRHRHGVVVLAATNRPQSLDEALRRPGRFDWEVPLLLPSQPDREATLRQCTAPLPLAADVRLASLAARTAGFAGADLIALAREAALRATARAAAGGGGVEVSEADLLAAVKAVGASVKRAAGAEAVEPLAWDDIGGVEEAKRRLRRAVEWPLHHAAAFARLGIKPPCGVLLHGPPGCSKTSLARAAAGAAQCTFLFLSGAQVYSPFVGEAERAVRDFFALGRACAPSVLFIDEIEALVGNRASGGCGGGDTVQSRVLSTLLNEMDGVSSLEQVLLIGATNRPDLVDAALMRPGRFDELLEVLPPDEHGRLQVLRIHTRGMALADDVDLEDLASRSCGWSGAQLSSLCREAGMLALREDLTATKAYARHFEAAWTSVHGFVAPIDGDK